MSLNSTTVNVSDLEVSKSISDVLNQVSQNFIIYLPLIFLIFGFIGFIGNLFTYLQPELRSNTCCIYSLSGSITDIIDLLLNLFPNYLSAKYGIYIPWYTSSFLCKLNLFLLIFPPHLSTNFLLMAIIDRFACTCSLGSPIRRLNQLKMVPFMIAVTILVSCLASLYAPLLFDLVFNPFFGFWCTATQPTTTSVLYVTLIGLSQPVVMLIFVLLTYRNVRQSRRRVGGATTGANVRQPRTQFIVMIFSQIFTTACFSLQWIVMYMYSTFTADEDRSADQLSILFFVYSVSNNCYYLNNVKAFYVSILTSGLFRKTFIKGLVDLLPRQMRPRFQVSQTNGSMATVTKIRRGMHQDVTIKN